MAANVKPQSARERILSAKKNWRSQEVEVPEWGMTVVIREPSAGAVDSYNAAVIDLGADGKPVAKLGNFRCEMLVRCLYDTDGNRIFRDEDAALLAEQPSEIITRLYEIAQPIFKSAPGVEEAKND